MRLVSKILAEKRKREPVRPRALKNNVPGLFGVHDKRKLAKRAVYCSLRIEYLHYEGRKSRIKEPQSHRRMKVSKSELGR